MNEIRTVKSGILTARVEYMPNAAFKAFSQAQLIVLPFKFVCNGSRLVLAGTLTKAHMSMLNHAIGTTILFKVKKCLIF